MSQSLAAIFLSNIRYLAFPQGLFAPFPSTYAWTGIRPCDPTALAKSLRHLGSRPVLLERYPCPQITTDCQNRDRNEKSQASLNRRARKYIRALCLVGSDCTGTHGRYYWASAVTAGLARRSLHSVRKGERIAQLFTP
ncbi:hypothetical protein V2G26_010252 [Clonostachys chloroleuca]